MTRLKNLDQLVNPQILDNESNAEYNNTIRDFWKLEYQLFLTNLHCCNAAKCAIYTFKAHFLSILSVIAEYFSKNLWDMLITQTEMALNILRQSTLKPTTYSWENSNGPTSYKHTPLGTLGCKLIMHKKTNTRPSWYFRGKYGWNVGVPLEIYRCQFIVAKDTRSVQESTHSWIFHHHLTQPTLTHTDRILHRINMLSCALTDVPTVACDAQLRAITEPREIFQQWADPSQLITVPPQPIHQKITKLGKRGKWRKCFQPWHHHLHGAQPGGGCAVSKGAHPSDDISNSKGGDISSNGGEIRSKGAYTTLAESPQSVRLLWTRCPTHTLASPPTGPSSHWICRTTHALTHVSLCLPCASIR